MAHFVQFVERPHIRGWEKIVRVPKGTYQLPGFHGPLHHLLHGFVEVAAGLSQGKDGNETFLQHPAIVWWADVVKQADRVERCGFVPNVQFLC